VNQTAINAIAFGGLGRDVLQAGSGRDTLLGGPGRDQLSGDGDDRLRAGAGASAQSLVRGGASLNRRLTNDPVLLQGLSTLQNAGVGATALNTGTVLPRGQATINVLNGTTTGLNGLNANLTGLDALSGLISAGSLTGSPLFGVTTNPLLGTLSSAFPATPFNVPQVSPGASFQGTTSVTTLNPITGLDASF
jgi:hypothetical protein